MKKNKLTLTIRELALLAATRGVIGIGAGLLLGNKLSADRRKTIGLPLLIGGVLSTIPIARHVFMHNR